MPNAFSQVLTAGTARYVVTWTPATTNTDGSPIGTILSTKVQVSATATFAQPLEWTNPGTSTSWAYSTAPNNPVLYWRAAHVTVNGQSAWTTPAVKTEEQWIAEHKPSCWPKPVGAGSWVQASQNSEGFALYWQCDEATGKKHAGFVGLWSQLKPDWMRQLATATATGSFGALWDANIKGPTQQSLYVAVRPLWNAMRDANPIVVATDKVKPNGTLTSRPAYAVSAGTRTSTVAGRVGVGQDCDCTKFQQGEYCSVEGRDNLATAAIDVLPATAAVCAKTP